MTDRAENMGRCIRQRRRKLNLTQAAIANCIGVNPARISRLEAGTATMTVEELIQLAICLGVDRDFIIEGTRVKL